MMTMTTTTTTIAPNNNTRGSRHRHVSSLWQFFFSLYFSSTNIYLLRLHIHQQPLPFFSPPSPFFKFNTTMPVFGHQPVFKAQMMLLHLSFNTTFFSPPLCSFLATSPLLEPKQCSTAIFSTTPPSFTTVIPVLGPK